MADDKVLKSIISLRDSYENKKNDVIMETEEAYKKGLWTYHAGMTYRSADYIEFINELNTLIKSYEKEC